MLKLNNNQNKNEKKLVLNYCILAVFPPNRRGGVEGEIYREKWEQDGKKERVKGDICISKTSNNYFNLNTKVLEQI